MAQFTYIIILETLKTIIEEYCIIAIYDFSFSIRSLVVAVVVDDVFKSKKIGSFVCNLYTIS